MILVLVNIYSVNHTGQVNSLNFRFHTNVFVKIVPSVLSNVQFVKVLFIESKFLNQAVILSIYTFSAMILAKDA